MRAQLIHGLLAHILNDSPVSRTGVEIELHAMVAASVTVFRAWHWLVLWLLSAPLNLPVVLVLENSKCLLYLFFVVIGWSKTWTLGSLLTSQSSNERRTTWISQSLGHLWALGLLLLPFYGVYVKPGTGLDYSNLMIQGCFGMFRACPRFYRNPFSCHAKYYGFGF